MDDTIKNQNENGDVDLNEDKKKEEIIKMKKEIVELKEQRTKDKLIIDEMKNNFTKEIESLKSVISKLNKEIKELKKNNISNINNINNISDEEMKDEKYSIECLSRKLKIEILKGTENANIEVMIRNNSEEKYPNNSYLICDNKNSLLLCEKIQLVELAPKQQQKVNILFKNLTYISRGTYKCIVKLQIDGKIYNSFFEISIEVFDNPQVNKFDQQNVQSKYSFKPNIALPNIFDDKNKNGKEEGNLAETIYSFRNIFSIYNEDITDQKIAQALKENNFEFNRAFESLFQ